MKCFERKANPHSHSEGWFKKIKSNNYYYEKCFAMMQSASKCRFCSRTWLERKDSQVIRFVH